MNGANAASPHLIDLAISAAEFEGGVRLDSLPFGASIYAGLAVSGKAKAKPWTREEDDFLKKNLGYMTEAEIANALGRTPVAVHLRWFRDLDLPGPSKAPGWLTAHQAARMLGVDGHKITHWVDAGLLPGRNMAGGRVIRLIRETTFLRWAVSPKNWVYFDKKRVRDAHLRRLLELEAERWGDEWWSTKRIADHYGVETQDVKRYIQLGRIQAYRLPVSLGGRHENRYWSNWFVLRSEALKPGLVFVRRKDIKSRNDPYQRRFTPAADAWILKARDELGMTFIAIGRTMKVGKWSYDDRTNRLIAYRYQQLKKELPHE